MQPNAAMAGLAAKTQCPVATNSDDRRPLPLGAGAPVAKLLGPERIRQSKWAIDLKSLTFPIVRELRLASRRPEPGARRPALVAGAMLHLHDAPQHGLFGTSLWLFKRGFDALVVAYGGGRRAARAQRQWRDGSPHLACDAAHRDRTGSGRAPNTYRPRQARASARRRISIRSPR